MHINDCGISFIHPKTFHIDRPNGSGDYLFVLTESPAIFIRDEKKKRMPEGTVILYKKGEPQNFMAAGTSYRNAFIHFSMDADDEAFASKLPLIYGIPFINLNTEKFMPFQKLVWENFVSDLPDRDEMITHLMRVFLISLSREMSLVQATYQNNEIRELMEKLHLEIVRDVNKNWTVEEMAARISISPSYFQNLYKQMYGRSCIEDTIFYKLKYAKYLLLMTDYPINTISELCGYSSMTHFSRQFKQKTGITASEYRAQKEEKN